MAAVVIGDCFSRTSMCAMIVWGVERGASRCQALQSGAWPTITIPDGAAPPRTPSLPQSQQQGIGPGGMTLLMPLVAAPFAWSVRPCALAVASWAPAAGRFGESSVGCALPSCNKRMGASPHKSEIGIVHLPCNCAGSARRRHRSPQAINMQPKPPKESGHIRQAWDRTPPPPTITLALDSGSFQLSVQ